MLKYINFKKLGVVVFGPHVQHADVAAKIADDTPVSAGFVRVSRDGELVAYGDSFSLGLKSNPNVDTLLLNLYKRC